MSKAVMQVNHPEKLRCPRCGFTGMFTLSGEATGTCPGCATSLVRTERRAADRRAAEDEAAWTRADIIRNRRKNDGSAERRRIDALTSEEAQLRHCMREIM